MVGPVYAPYESITPGLREGVITAMLVAEISSPWTV